MQIAEQVLLVKLLLGSWKRFFLPCCVHQCRASRQEMLVL